MYWEGGPDRVPTSLIRFLLILPFKKNFKFFLYLLFILVQNLQNIRGGSWSGVQWRELVSMVFHDTEHGTAWFPVATTTQQFRAITTLISWDLYPNRASILTIYNFIWSLWYTIYSSEANQSSLKTSLTLCGMSCIEKVLKYLTNLVEGLPWTGYFYRNPQKLIGFFFEVQL